MKTLLQLLFLITITLQPFYSIADTEIKKPASGTKLIPGRTYRFEAEDHNWDTEHIHLKISFYKITKDINGQEEKEVALPVKHEILHTSNNNTDLRHFEYTVPECFFFDGIRFEAVSTDRRLIFRNWWWRWIDYDQSDAHRDYEVEKTVVYEYKNIDVKSTCPGHANGFVTPTYRRHVNFDSTDPRDVADEVSGIPSGSVREYWGRKDFIFYNHLNQEVHQGGMFKPINDTITEYPNGEPIVRTYTYKMDDACFINRDLMGPGLITYINIPSTNILPIHNATLVSLPDDFPCKSQLDCNFENVNYTYLPTGLNDIKSLVSIQQPSFEGLVLDVPNGGRIRWRHVDENGQVSTSPVYLDEGEDGSYYKVCASHVENGGFSENEFFNKSIYQGLIGNVTFEIPRANGLEYSLNCDLKVNAAVRVRKNLSSAPLVTLSKLQQARLIYEILESRDEDLSLPGGSSFEPCGLIEEIYGDPRQSINPGMVPQNYAVMIADSEFLELNLDSVAHLQTPSIDLPDFFTSEVNWKNLSNNQLIDMENNRLILKSGLNNFGLIRSIKLDTLLIEQVLFQLKVYYNSDADSLFDDELSQELIIDSLSNKQDGLSDSAEIEQSEFTGVASSDPIQSFDVIFGEELIVFPNPASNFIQLQTFTSFDKWLITNKNGQVVLEGNEILNEKIDVQQLSKGIYSLILVKKSKIVGVDSFIKH